MLLLMITKYKNLSSCSEIVYTLEVTKQTYRLPRGLDGNRS